MVGALIMTLLTIHAILSLRACIATGMTGLLVWLAVGVGVVRVLGQPVRLTVVVLGIAVHVVPVLAIHPRAAVIVPIATTIAYMSHAQCEQY